MLYPGFSWAEFSILAGIGILGFIVNAVVVLARGASEEEGCNNFFDQFLGVPFGVFFGLLAAHAIAQPVVPILEGYLSGHPPTDLVTLLAPDGLKLGAVVGLVRLILVFCFAIPRGSGSVIYRLRVNSVLKIVLSALVAIPDEILSRLTSLTVGVWVITSILSWTGHGVTNHPPAVVYWILISIIALTQAISQSVVFWGSFTEFDDEPPLILGIGRFIVDLASAMLFGYLFWHFSLEVAIASHMCFNAVRGLVQPQVLIKGSATDQ